MGRKSMRWLLIIGMISLFTVPVHPVFAQRFDRSHSTDFMIQVDAFDSESETGSNPLRVEADDTLLFGIAYGYTWEGGKLNVNGNLLFGQQELETTEQDVGDPFTRKMDMDVTVFDLNLDYYLLNRRLTPMATAGFGIVSYGDFGDVSISEGDLSVNAGLGLRWDFADTAFIKATYRYRYTELEDTDYVGFDGPSIALGLRF